MTTQNHIMVDIETFGTRPNAPIVSIGACFFNPETGEIGERFYRAIDIEDSMRFGVPDGGTIKWWLKQSDDARASAIEGTMSLADVLTDFAEFYKKGRNAQLWGNGASFDPVLLEYAFIRCTGHKAPWDFWQIRCVRTIVELAKGICDKPKTFGKGTAHNALDDAVHQAEFVSKMWQALKGIRAPAQGDDMTRAYRPEEIAAAVAAKPSKPEYDPLEI